MVKKFILILVALMLLLTSIDAKVGGGAGGTANGNRKSKKEVCKCIYDRVYDVMVYEGRKPKLSSSDLCPLPYCFNNMQMTCGTEADNCYEPHATSPTMYVVCSILGVLAVIGCVCCYYKSDGSKDD